MREISIRRLQSRVSELDSLPVALTRDGQVFAVVLTIEHHRRLIREYIHAQGAASEPATVRVPKRELSQEPVQNQAYRDRQAQEPPWYDPQVHRAGDLVRVRRGAKVVTLTVPELDGDGHPVPL